MPDKFVARTRVSLNGKCWCLNDQVSYRGAPAEGLLLNVRMVNDTFEDRHRPDLAPAEITQRFLERLPEYVGAGVQAFTIGLQGGYPGYKDALNSAFEPDGNLRLDYLQRVGRVIEACDRLGAVVILNCYYQLQTPVLRDEPAVCNGVGQVAGWLRQQAYSNVLVEIANEFGQDGFAHPIFKDEQGIAALIHLFRQQAPGILVSASRQAELEDAPLVWRISDFILVHMNRVPLDEYPGRLASLKAYGKPVICSEDRKIGMEGVCALELCIENGCSWGLNVRDANQYTPPFRFDGTADDVLVYARLRDLAGSHTS